MTEANLFISHASTDRPLADLFKDTLVLGGVPRSTIFYSSAPSTGIPIGDDFRQHLRTKLRESGLVVQLISAEFLKRHWCLFEVEAAWALDLATYPIVVPPLTRQQAAAYIGDINTGLLGDDSDVEDLFSELSDRVQQNFAHTITVSEWNEAVRGFKARRPVAALASEVEDELFADDSELAPVKRADDVNKQTRQEQIAPYLEQIGRRQRLTEIFVRIAGQDCWLGFSTSAMRQFGMDHNVVHIYYKDPTIVERPPLDTFASWNEGMTLSKLVEVVRRVLDDDPDRRSMASFDAGRVITDFRNELYRVSGR